jgi:hypothetical protein
MQFFPLLVMLESFCIFLINFESRLVQLGPSIRIVFTAAGRVAVVQQVWLLYLSDNVVLDLFTTIYRWRLAQRVSFAFQHRGYRLM